MQLSLFEDICFENFGLTAGPYEFFTIVAAAKRGRDGGYSHELLRFSDNKVSASIVVRHFSPVSSICDFTNP